MNKNIAVLILASAVVVTEISCSKNTTMTPAQRADLLQAMGASADQPLKDFGVVEVSEHTPKRLVFAEGKTCVVTTTVLPDGKLQLFLTPESKTTNGTATRSGVITSPGIQAVFVIDGVVIALTPTLKLK